MTDEEEKSRRELNALMLAGAQELRESTLELFGECFPWLAQVAIGKVAPTEEDRPFFQLLASFAAGEVLIRRKTRELTTERPDDDPPRTH